MNTQQRHALEVRNTDVQGAVNRFNGDENLYVTCISLFLEDTTVRDLNRAIRECQWDDAFTAAHALKGLAGNLGFIPLMHATGQLLIVIRGGRTKEISEYAAQVNSDYRDIIDAIRTVFSDTERTESDKNDIQ